jgi:outer membrane lipoprotein SlyB
MRATASINAFRSQSRADFSAVVRSQLGAQQFLGDHELCSRYPGLHRVAKQTVAMPPSSDNGNPGVLLRKWSEQAAQSAGATARMTYRHRDAMVAAFFVLAMAVVLLFLPQKASAQSWVTSYGGSTYEPRGEARRVQDVKYATVLDVRLTYLKEEGTNYAASSVGGILGALAGSKLGNGNGTYAAQAALGTIGAVIGNRMANRTLDGVEVVIRHDDGRTQVVVQERDGARLDIGDRVRVISGSQTRVVYAPEARNEKAAAATQVKSTAELTEEIRQLKEKLQLASANR